MNSTVLSLVFFSIIFIVDFVKCGPASNRIIRIFKYIEENENSFEHINSFVDRRSSSTEMADNDIWSVIRTEWDFYFALRTAIKFSSLEIINDLLHRVDIFRNSDVDVDFFILLTIPKLDPTTAKGMTEYIFASDIRGRLRSSDSVPSNIGTISFDSLQIYAAHLFSHPEEIAVAYELFRIALQASVTFSIESSYSKIIMIFDLIVGKISNVGLDKMGFATLDILSRMDTESIEDDQEIMDRLSSAYEYYFSSEIEDKFENLYYWDISSVPLKRAFQLIYEHEIDNALFNLIIKTCSHNISTSLLREISLNRYLRQIPDLSPFNHEPLMNRKLAQKLITKFLVLAVEEGKKVYVDPSRILTRIPLVIRIILNGLGTEPDWPQISDLLETPDVFDQTGLLNWDVLWILGHFSDFFKVVSREMVSSDTFNRIMSKYYILLPKIDKKIDNDRDVLERLFVLFDVKAELKKLLISPKKNMLDIKKILRSFRFESDFQLVSKLPAELRNRRSVEVKHVELQNCEYLYGIVYESEFMKQILCDSDKYPLVPKVKLILAVNRLIN